jgi:SAM-dependent methyltransferase
MTYADYLFRTGEPVVAWEDAFGRYLWTSRFADRKRVLDIGPGRCWFTRQAPRLITGLDIEPAVVDHYRAQGLQMRQGSITSIPYGEGTFDGVFCCWVLEHLQDPELAVREITRVLVPGGYACVIVPSARTVTRGFYDDYTHIRPFTAVSLGQLADAAGFGRRRVTPLFWTRGGGRLAHRLEPDRLQMLLRVSDRRLRRMGIVNRANLVLEGWR